MNTYKKTNWQDSPSTDTPLDAEHLNNIEDGIEAVTESVTALETSKADKVDTYSKVETNNLLYKKEDISNKVDDIDIECGSEQYPTAHAVKDYLNSNYYDASDTEDRFQFKLEAGDNVTIEKAGMYTSAEKISVNLDSKYDASNVETGSGELTVYSEDVPISTALYTYQRVGDFVTVSLYIKFTQAEMGKTKSYQLLGLPFKAENAVYHSVVTNNKNKLTVAVGVGTSTLTVLTQGEAVNLTNNEMIADSIYYKINGTKKQGDLITYNQVRDEVQSYLDDVTYDSSDYTVSSIADYVTEKSENRPCGCAVELNDAGTLIVTDNTSGGTYSTASIAGTNYIYNTTPGAVCHYVNIVDDKITQSGTVKATGSLRMIKAVSAFNIRDLGGWACDGGKIKYGKLFRGSSLWAADRSVLVDFLGISDDLDLRWDSEITSDSSVLGNDINYTHINGCWYGGQYSANLKEEVKYAIETINKGRVLYFHCAGGADRTGTLAMMLEAILGVSQSDIDKDYELTSFNTGVVNDSVARRRNENDWMGLIGFFDSYSGDTLRDRVVDFCVKQGISINDINKFRHNMIDGNAEDLSASSVTVTNNLTNATTNNAATSVEYNSSYIATITAGENYTLTGATVTVTMGSTDITASAYADGVINIANITGDIIINVIAKKATATNILTSSFVHNGTTYEAIGFNDETRLSVSNGSTSAATERVTIGYCPITSGDIVRIKGLTYATSSDGTVAIARYNSSKTFVSANRLYTGETTPLNGIACSFDNDNSMLTITVTDIDGFIRLCGIGSTGADCIVTINEEIII